MGAPKVAVTGVIRGFAWITFDSLAAVTKAASWSGSYLSNRIVYVHPANNVAPSDHVGKHDPALCEDSGRGKGRRNCLCLIKEVVYTHGCTKKRSSGEEHLRALNQNLRRGSLGGPP